MEDKLLERKVCIVAGGAGFIGVNLVTALLKKNYKVIVGDNLSLGSFEALVNTACLSLDNCLKVDLSSEVGVAKLFDLAFEKYPSVSEVWHLAANSDIPAGVDDPGVDIKDTFLTTFHLLNESKRRNIKKFNFSSSSAVYGDWGNKPLKESLGPLKPISNYGAMKLASEAQICAATESFLEESNIFRFPNVVGVPATHGVILDFFNKLRLTPHCLQVLGNGLQKKSYLHVSELVDAMLFVSNLPKRGNRVEIVNIGCSDSGILVRDIAEIIVNLMSPSANIVYGKDDRGWLGDVPRFFYDTSYLQKLGWSPKLSSREAVELAAKEIFDGLI